jgi:hypothetical protein
LGLPNISVLPGLERIGGKQGLVELPGMAPAASENSSQLRRWSCKIRKESSRSQSTNWRLDVDGNLALALW